MKEPPGQMKYISILKGKSYKVTLATHSETGERACRFNRQASQDFLCL